jgi:hypothetical protein
MVKAPALHPSTALFFLTTRVLGLVAAFGPDGDPGVLRC